MKTNNLVTLSNYHQAADEMYWQSDKSDFVLYEDWKMELHDEQDYQNAKDTAETNGYMGVIRFEHSEITAFELGEEKKSDAKFEVQKYIGQEPYGSAALANDYQELGRVIMNTSRNDFNEYSNREDLSIEIFDTEKNEVVNCLRIQ